MTPVLVLALASLGQTGNWFEMPLQISGIASMGRLEYAVVCRHDSSAPRHSQWRAIDARDPKARAPRNARCRVLVRPQGASRYFASHEAVWAERAGRLPLQQEWLRSVRAPASSSQVTWVGASPNPGPECLAFPAGTRCLYVPAADAGVVLAEGMDGVHFAISRPGDDASVGWRTARWGRLVRARAPMRGSVKAAVHVLVPAFRSTAGRLRDAAVSSDAQVHRLGPQLFWIEGRGTDGRLDLTAPGAATVRMPLSDVSGPAAQACDVLLPPEETIEGDVRSRGALVEGAVVLLTRLIDDPESRRSGAEGDEQEEDGRLREFVAETTSDGSGRFRFAGLAREPHELLVVHPARGRARLVVMAPGRPHVAIEPRAIVRGRVLSRGVPAAGAVVSVLPAFDAVARAGNPIELFSESVRAGIDGRFESVLPDRGRVSLTVAHERGALRMDLGDVATFPPVVDIGDLGIEEPIDVEVHAALDAGCVMQAAGPLGEPGMAVARALPLAPGRWQLRARLPGRWLFEASCGAAEVFLSPPIVSIQRTGQQPIVLEVRR